METKSLQNPKEKKKKEDGETENRGEMGSHTQEPISSNMIIQTDKLVWDSIKARIRLNFSFFNSHILAR